MGGRSILFTVIHPLNKYLLNAFYGPGSRDSIGCRNGASIIAVRMDISLRVTQIYM